MHGLLSALILLPPHVGLRQVVLECLPAAVYCRMLQAALSKHGVLSLCVSDCPMPFVVCMCSKMGRAYRCL